MPNAPKRDLTGQRFGRLVAVARTGRLAGNRSCIWQCLCDCGQAAESSVDQLVNGLKKSCGCLFSSDLTGRRFGRLLVTGKAEKPAGKKVNGTLWTCLCDCGTSSVKPRSSLIGGLTRSCSLRCKKRRSEEMDTESISETAERMAADGVTAVDLDVSPVAYYARGEWHETPFQSADLATVGRWLHQEGADSVTVADVRASAEESDE